jgi:signal peptidase I
MGIVVSTGGSKTPVPLPVQREKRRQARFLLGGGLVLVVLCFALLLRILAFEGVMITSGSMQPTLFKGDYTLVDHRIAIRSTWARGDVIVFEAPETWNGPGVTLVKRVIGLPGEEVGVSAGRVFVNNRFLTENYLSEAPAPEDERRIKLEAGQYYVMGDNRNNSDDSRNNGPIEEKNIKGRALCLLWPISRFTRLETPEYGAVVPAAR